MYVRFLKLYRTALDPAHIQDVVDQAQKMRAGGADLAKVILHLDPVITVGLCQGRKSNDGIHRCADIMGHAV